jgi:hypothetical protein
MVDHVNGHKPRFVRTAPIPTPRSTMRLHVNGAAALTIKVREEPEPLPVPYTVPKFTRGDRLQPKPAPELVNKDEAGRRFIKTDSARWIRDGDQWIAPPSKARLMAGK